MIENVAAALGRIAAIQSTIGTRITPTATATSGAATPDFREMLAQRLASPAALAAATTTPTWPGTSPWPTGTATTTPTGEIPSSGPLPGLEAYPNGEIPVSALAPIPDGEYLWGPAAAAFNAMHADAARAGIALGVTDAYRPLADQERLAEELGLYSQGGWAAVPGTSQHGWGRAVDLELDDRAQAWMREHAQDYGFHETVPNEPWHWEYHP